MWLGLTAIVLAASIGFTVLAIAVQRFPRPPSGSRPLGVGSGLARVSRNRASGDLDGTEQPYPRFGGASTFGGGVLISLNACSHKISGLRSPAFARSMIFAAMARLTPSSQSPTLRAMQPRADGSD